MAQNGQAQGIIVITPIAGSNTAKNVRVSLKHSGDINVTPATTASGFGICAVNPPTPCSIPFTVTTNSSVQLNKPYTVTVNSHIYGQVPGKAPGVMGNAGPNYQIFPTVTVVPAASGQSTITISSQTQPATFPSLSTSDQTLGSFTAQVSGNVATIKSATFLMIKFPDDPQPGTIQEATLYIDGISVGQSTAIVNSQTYDPSTITFSNQPFTLSVGTHNLVIRGKLGSDFLPGQVMWLLTTPQTDWSGASFVNGSDAVSSSLLKIKPIVTVSLTPSSPTTSDFVSIRARVSDQAGIDSIVLSLDNNSRACKNPTDGSCFMKAERRKIS